MTYTKETTEKLVSFAAAGFSVQKIVSSLTDLGAKTSERSVIAKLASLGLYKKRPYLTKQGEIPISKGAYIEKLAKALGSEVNELESLNKVNKNVLKLITLTLNRDSGRISS